jgi:hypothetical protein
MRRNVVTLVLVVLLVVVGVLLYGGRGASPADAARARAGDEPSRVQLTPEPAGAAAAVPRDAAHATTRAESRARRDVLRQKIAQQIASNARTDSPHGPAEARPRANEESSRQAGGLKNKLGGRDELVSFLNSEFMPLADECIEQARERSPKLAGMLAIGIETIADEELGAVVDVADPAARNEVVDPLLFECIRESAFSLVVPAPIASGSEKFELTMSVGEEP